MKPGVTVLCVTGSFLAASVTATAAQMSTADLMSFCSKNSPVCGIYLQGAYDGILQAAKNDGTRLVCAPQEPTAAQLKQYFVTANALAGESHGNDPAINMAYVAFKIAMPCE